MRTLSAVFIRTASCCLYVYHLSSVRHGSRLWQYALAVLSLAATLRRLGRVESRYADRNATPNGRRPYDPFFRTFPQVGRIHDARVTDLDDLNRVTARGGAPVLLHRVPTRKPCILGVVYTHPPPHPRKISQKHSTHRNTHDNTHLTPTLHPLDTQVTPAGNFSVQQKCMQKCMCSRYVCRFVCDPTYRAFVEFQYTR